MTDLTIRGRAVRRGILSLSAIALMTAAGCQVDISGQTLPSSYYLTDDVQYFPPGNEFKLQREADAMAAAQAEEVRTGRIGGGREAGPGNRGAAADPLAAPMP